jgi:hypothetical protein
MYIYNTKTDFCKINKGEGKRAYLTYSSLLELLIDFSPKFRALLIQIEQTQKRRTKPVP